ncbi:hypothetical protein [Paracoccus contaminans]|uniref:Uncharacterized protein n=1 Tax=Paracoccus contaminans TaxID=1945662 RepID=A0A1W6CU45_9RHOB|nr:hypothetical protein [Paracoccus contaminans]ARJ68407.1 hypothetical protein B0A89_00805 [Paracoccus contaminans]
MSRDRRSDKPGATQPGGRDARLGAALRANLARRKAQARQRADGAHDDDNDNGAGMHPPQEPPHAAPVPPPGPSED